MTLTGFARILLIDDPAGATVSTHELTRPAEPGEAYDFSTLAADLSTATGAASAVQSALDGVTDSRTAVIVHASGLGRLLAAAEGTDLATRTVVVGARRDAILPMLELNGVAGVVEANQYFAWMARQPADAAVFASADIAATLGPTVEVTPLANPAFARLRIDGGDLPGLIGSLLR